MSKKYEDIFQETYENVCKDRKTLDEIIGALLIEGQGKPTTTISGKIAYLTEIKIRSNDQMIKLLEVRQKEPKSSNILDEKEAEKVWDEINELS